MFFLTSMLRDLPSDPHPQECVCVKFKARTLADAVNQPPKSHCNSKMAVAWLKSIVLESLKYECNAQFVVWMQTQLSCWYCPQKDTISIFNFSISGGRGGLVFQAGCHPRKRTFKTHPKHVFFRCENIPKYMFLDAFFFICLSYPFQNLSIWPKTHPFFKFFTFLHP